MCPWPTLIVAAIATGVCICLSIVFTTDRSKLLITKFGTLEKAHWSQMLGGQISGNRARGFYLTRFDQRMLHICNWWIEIQTGKRESRMTWKGSHWCRRLVQSLNCKLLARMLHSYSSNFVITVMTCRRIYVGAVRLSRCATVRLFQ